MRCGKTRTLGAMDKQLAIDRCSALVAPLCNALASRLTAEFPQVLTTVLNESVGSGPNMMDISSVLNAVSLTPLRTRPTMSCL